MLSCEYCEIFAKINFEEHLRMVASVARKRSTKKLLKLKADEKLSTMTKSIF